MKFLFALILITANIILNNDYVDLRVVQSNGSAVYG